jgi:hypothetical protein
MRKFRCGTRKSRQTLHDTRADERNVSQTPCPLNEIGLVSYLQANRRTISSPYFSC